eukprot:8242683-Pyramimonas_sp.AAC.1
MKSSKTTREGRTARGPLHDRRRQPPPAKPSRSRRKRDHRENAPNKSTCCSSRLRDLLGYPCAAGHRRSDARGDS